MYWNVAPVPGRSAAVQFDGDVAARRSAQEAAAQPASPEEQRSPGADTGSSRRSLKAHDSEGGRRAQSRLRTCRRSPSSGAVRPFNISAAPDGRAYRGQQRVAVDGEPPTTKRAAAFAFAQPRVFS